MPLDDIEQDEAPRDDKTRQSLNTTNRTNTKRDNVDKDTADKIGNERQDTDGGHKRDTTSGGAVVSSGNKEVKKDPPPEEKTDDDNAISGFIQKLISGTFGDTKEDEEEIKTGNNQDEEDRPPSDEELDSGEGADTPPVNTTGSDRSGEFGSGTIVDPPKGNFEGRNRSKGNYIEYKGVKYQIDRKGTEYSDTETDIAKQNAAVDDDTVTVGNTVIMLKDLLSMSSEERQKTFDTALSGAPATPPATKKFTVKSIFWVVKRDSKYGAIVEVGFDNNGTRVNATFDDTGNIEILGVKYTAKEIFIDDGSDVVTWLKKQVDDTKSEELSALYAGWGFTVETPPADPPNDENPATNPQDPEQKFEPKEKSNASPEGAPAQVENSKALTEIKMRELEGKRDGVPATMRVQSYIKSVYGPGNPSVSGGVSAGPTSTGYWAFRSNVNGTANQAGSANEYKIVESSITGAVKFGPGKATWKGIVKKAILGVQVDPEKNLKITNYPIVMNAPEVGIPNTAIPYVFENQTEQHRMVTGGIFNESGWGIGSMEGHSSWAERSHWCGYHAKFCWNHSGYIPAITLDNPAGAGNATDVYSKRLPKPVTPDSEGTYASLPMFVNPDTGNMEVDPDLYNMGSPIKGAKDAREHCHLYKFYKQTSYTKKTIQKIPGTKKVNGKLVEVMNEKELKEQIAITVYEQMLPNPISAFFIRGIHFADNQMTEMGKKLMDHFLSQRGWEASIITRGGHVEVCPYLNPDGTMWRLGGNTGSDAIAGNAAAGSGKVSGAGWRFCCQPGKIWSFAGDGPGGHIAFHKLINSQSSPEYQKVEPTMNGIFRRTELVDNYMKAVANKQKGILATLKNTLYDQIVEPG
jgi:hypothetical protein